MARTSRCQAGRSSGEMGRQCRPATAAGAAVMEGRYGLGRGGVTPTRVRRGAGTKEVAGTKETAPAPWRGPAPEVSGVAQRAVSPSVRRWVSSWMAVATPSSASACLRAWWAQKSSSPTGSATRTYAWAPQRSQRSCAVSGAVIVAFTSEYNHELLQTFPGWPCRSLPAEPARPGCERRHGVLTGPGPPHPPHAPRPGAATAGAPRSEEHTSELQSRGHLV